MKSQLHPNRGGCSRTFALLWSLIGLSCGPAFAQAPTARPNILWISSEDHGQEMGCYGDEYAETPNVDALAARGLRFRHVWSNAPVCAPARTTIISGIYPTSLGAENMRSMIAMPPGTAMFPALMRQAGYYCTNNNKEDYNLITPNNVWDESSRMAHYKNRREDQPFFAVFNATASHESAIRGFKGQPRHDPAGAPVPAFHPDTPLVRRDWAIYYDSVSDADAIAGEHLRELEAAGLADSTIIFYWGDHGSGMPRFKRWPSDSGLRVPLVVYIPEAFAHLRPADYSPGGQSELPVGFIDFAPTMLSLIGIAPPAWMQGHAFLGPHAGAESQHLFGFRGRMDERLDLVRSVTDGRYVYLRNYMPHLSQGQHVAYQMETPTTRQWRELFDQGQLNAAQARFWQVPKDPEELYDLASDPDEVVNLADSPAHQEILSGLRSVLREQILQTRDVGFIPEGERFRACQEQTPYELGHDDKQCDLTRILAAAELASSTRDNTPATTDSLAALLDSDDAVVRYWGAMGLLMRGQTTVARHSPKLIRLLEDPSPAVLVVAAEALARFGSQPERDSAVATLLRLADWSTHDVFTVMASVAALEILGNRLPKIADEIALLPVTGPVPHARYSSYVPRLLTGLKELAAQPN
jgi:uncharacterized sulfatase